MDNIIQSERLRYAKICEERTLFHGLINNCHGKSKNLKLQGSLRVLFLLCFSFRSSPPKLFSKLAVIKFRKLPLETPAVDFYFSCRSWTFIPTEIELCSIVKKEVLVGLIGCDP